MSIEFENDSVDVGVQKIEYYIDKDSSLKFLAPYIASSNFNGTIPIVDTFVTASFLKPGMTIAFDGGGVGDQYFPIISIEFDDLDLIDTPIDSITIKYLDANNIVTSREINKSASVAVRYEDWDNKDLGSLGWSITSGGNAIFSNVGVRGRIEATEGEISGDLTLGGSLTASTNFGFVQLSASGIYGVTSSGNFHLDTTTGEIDITGNINANSGQIKTLNIGPTQYPIFNIFGVFTSSATTSASNSGQFILVTPIYKDYAPPPGGGPAGQVYNKKLIPGDVFRLQNTETTSSCVIEYYTPVGASAMFNTGAKVQPDDTGPWYPQDNKFIVLSASYGQSDFSYMSIGPYAVYVNKYHCKYHWYPDNFPLQIDFNGVTTASGSFNIGYLSFVASQESVFKTSNGFESRTSIDGIVLANYRKKITNYSLGDFLQVPDYIDLGGTFKLGNGNITFDGDNLNIIGNINATGGEISGNLSLGGSLTASTNLGFIQISASGILGVTASGRFHLDNLDGEITLTGNIHARGGSLEYLTIGDNYFPIHNIIGQKAYSPENDYNGAIILTIYQYKWDPNIPIFPNSGFQYPSLTTTEVKRYMAKGDYFKLSGVSASGAAINDTDGQPYSQSQTNSILNNTWRVESASVGFVETSASLVVDRYFCVRYTPYSLAFPTYNFENVSASSGSFTNGFLFSGEYNVKNGQSLTRIDGLTFSSINAGTTWNNYIPDFIDLSGRLRLANGYIRNTINTASGTTTGVYVRGSLQNMRPVQKVSASFFYLNTGISKNPNEKIDSENVITNYIYEINPITASCVFLIDEFGLVNGDYFDVVNIGTGSIIFKTYSASIDAYLNKKVLLGKWASATVRKRSSNSVLLSGDLS